LTEPREKIWHLEVAHEIDSNINPKNALGFNEIRPCKLKELPYSNTYMQCNPFSGMCPRAIEKR